MKKSRTYAHQLNTSYLPASNVKQATNKPKKKLKVSAKFLKMVDSLIEKHEDTLRELAKR